MSEPGSLIRSISGRPAARNFHSFVINEIGLGIVAGEMAVGSILPTDAQMMERYGVSRTVLREALKTLESKGMVEARPKVGTRVAPRGRWNFFDQQVLAWHFEARPNVQFQKGLFDVRLSLELLVADLATLHRSAEHVRLLKYWVHQMDVGSDSIESHALANLEVHRILADASENPMLRSAVGLVELTIALAAAKGNAEWREHGTEQHEELVRAVETANAEMAADTMRKVIESELKLVLA